MKLKGLAGALSMIVAVLLACWAARGDNSKSEFNWWMPGLDKWLLGMYSDGLAGWDVEPEKHVAHEAPSPRLVAGTAKLTTCVNGTLLPPAIWDLMFDPPLSEVYAGWASNTPAPFETNKIWAESFDGFGLPAGIEWDTVSHRASPWMIPDGRSRRHRPSNSREAMSRIGFSCSGFPLSLCAQFRRRHN